MISRVVYQPRFCSVEWIRIAVALRGFLAIAQHFVILACSWTSNTYAIVTCELKATYLFILHVSVEKT